MLLILNTTSTNTSTTIDDEYDEKGAAMYIAVILIWYSMGLALILFFQIRQRTFPNPSFIESSETQRLKNPFGNYDQMQKQILNELKDPERRQRLWKIYYSSSTENQVEPHPQYYQTINSDNITINHINRKLASFHRMDSHQHDDSMILPSNENSKFFSRRFGSSRRPMETIPSVNPPLLRIHSQPTPMINIDEQQQSLLNRTSRFTVEKVSANE